MIVSQQALNLAIQIRAMLLRHYLSKHRLCVHTWLSEHRRLCPHDIAFASNAYGNILKQLFVRIKYRILGNRFGTSEIPDNILEAIARTMLPDIREFFLSKEGQEELAAWKAEYEKNKKSKVG